MRAGYACSVSLAILASAVAPAARAENLAVAEGFPQIRLPTDRPRIFLRRSDLPGLRAMAGIVGYEDVKMFRGRAVAFGEKKAIYGKLKTLAEEIVAGRYKSPGRDYQGVTAERNGQINGALILGVVYLISGDARFGDAAARRLVGASRQPAKFGRYDFPMRYAAAADWCWDRLSDSEKQIVAHGLLVGADGQSLPAKYFESKWSGRAKERSFNYKNYGFSNANPMNNLYNLFVGVCLYGERIEDPERQGQVEQILRDHRYVLEKKVAPAFAIAGGRFGGWFEGQGYSWISRGNFINQLELWRVAAGRNLFPAMNSMRYFAWIQSLYLLPNGGVYSQYGSFGTTSILPEERFSVRKFFPLIASRYHDPFAQGWLPKQDEIERPEHLWRWMLWYDPHMPRKPYAELPKVWLMDGVGRVVMRSGWRIGGSDNPSADTFAVFECSDYYLAHETVDAGHFYIYHKGPLAAASFKGRHSHDSRNFNTLVVGGKGIALSIDSQFCRYGGDYRDYGENTAADLADFERFETTDEYVYIRGDLTPGYVDRGVTRYGRDFLWIKPDTFLVYDQLARKAGGPVEWGIHFVNPPILGGWDEPSQGERQEGAAQVNSFQAVAGGGWLFCQTVSPEKARVTVTDDGEDRAHRGGRWKVTVTAAMDPPGERIRWLHLLYATDRWASSPPAASRILAGEGKMIGAALSLDSRREVVLFGSRVSTVSYTYPAGSTAHHLLIGMAPDKEFQVAARRSGNQIQATVRPGGEIHSSGAGVLRFLIDEEGQVQPIEPGANRKPIAMAYAMAGLSGKAPFRASFKSDASVDLDGRIRSFRWEFGDGGAASGPNPTHVYQRRGVYRARLTVTDNDGAQDTYEMPIWAD